MSEGQHDLAHEFPGERDRIHALKGNHERFTELFQDWHVLAKELHAIEAGHETPSDLYVEELKKRRLLMKDEIYAILQGS